MKWFRNWLANQRDYRLLAQIKAEVDARIEYVNTGKNEWRYVPPGQQSQGDCQVFAETYYRDCNRLDLNAEKHVYRLKDGTFHAVCNVRTSTGKLWALDNRYQYPRPV